MFAGDHRSSVTQVSDVGRPQHPVRRFGQIYGNFGLRELLGKLWLLEKRAEARCKLKFAPRQVSEKLPGESVDNDGCPSFRR